MKDERITIRLREEDKQKIKIWCIKNNMTLSELCMISINRYIIKRVSYICYINTSISSDFKRILALMRDCR